MNKAQKILEALQNNNTDINYIYDLRDETVKSFCKKFKSIGASTDFSTISAEYKVYFQDFSKEKIGQLREEFLQNLWDELTKAGLRISASAIGIEIKTSKQTWLPKVLQIVVYLDVSADKNGLKIGVASLLDELVEGYPDDVDREAIEDYAIQLLKITDVLVKSFRLL